MSSRLLRTAVLSAALIFGPLSARLTRAADEPVKPADQKSTDQKPGDQKPGDAPARPQRPGGQGGPGGGGAGRFDPNVMLDRLDTTLKELNLSEEQKTKANELVAKVKKSIADKAGDAGGELRGAMQALTELRDSLKELLSDEQTKALAEKMPMLSRLGAGGPEAGGPGGRPGGLGTRPGAPGGQGGQGARPQVMQKAMAAALEKVDLPADVKAKIKALNDDVEKKVQAVIEEGKGDRAAIGEKIRPLIEERQKKMAEILSPEQLTTFRAAVTEQLEKARGENGGAGAGAGARRPRGEAPATPEKKPEDKKTDEKPAEEKKAESK